MSAETDLKDAYDTIAATGVTVYYSDQLTVDASNLLTTTPDTYCDMGLVVRPSDRDFDGEAFSDTRIRVRSWAKTLSGPVELDETIRQALEAAGWIRQTTTSLPFADGYWALASDYHKLF